jgi:membrane protease YdiL (CAAX protease family)
MTRISLQIKALDRNVCLVLWALAYLAGIALAEVLITFVEPRLGLAAHCLLLGSLIFHVSRVDGSNERAFLVSLALGPLIRILSLSLPLTQVPVLYWYLITSIPLFVAVLIAAPALGYSWPELGLTLRGLPVQMLIGISGLVFGIIEYFILRPDPLAPALEWAYVWWPALILLVSTGLLEELIFRGLLQRAAIDALGPWGLLYVAVLFATLHIGYQSLVDVLFALSVGLFLGWAVQRTGSLLGATLSHGLTNIILFLVMPFLSG